MKEIVTIVTAISIVVMATQCKGQPIDVKLGGKAKLSFKNRKFQNAEKITCTHRGDDFFTYSTSGDVTDSGTFHGGLSSRVTDRNVTGSLVEFVLNDVTDVDDGVYHCIFKKGAEWHKTPDVNITTYSVPVKEKWEISPKPVNDKMIIIPAGSILEIDVKYGCTKPPVSIKLSTNITEFKGTVNKCNATGWETELKEKIKVTKPMTLTFTVSHMALSKEEVIYDVTVSHKKETSVFSAGAIAGIVIGVAAVAVAIAVGAYLVWRPRNNDGRGTPHAVPTKTASS